ncbi:MAG TPA: phospholipase D-like domain-containing protein [Candidatus Xenobia bacterium]|jgi:phosphatidylserine/phosphatidylglycerophosphate/cardiolipin synthase-like enzyme
MQQIQSATKAPAKRPSHKPSQPQAPSHSADSTELSQSTSGNSVTPLFKGDGIFPKAEELIRGAKSSIQLEMYRLGYDKMIDALCDQAKKGLKVQVLLDPTPGYDAEDAKVQDANKAKLKAAGVQLLTYPVNKANMIDHVKLLVVDGHQAIIGGMNWDQHSPKNVDADVLVEGPAADKLESLYNHDWEFAGGTPLKTTPSKAGVAAAKGDADIRILTTTPADETYEIKDALLDNIKNAKKSIHMMAFCLANKDITEALKEAKKANPALDVQVLLEPGRPVVFQNSKTAKDLKEAGIDVKFLNVDLETQERLHAKLSTFDGDKVLVGSSNFTEAGFKINHEADVEITSKSVGTAFDAFFKEQADRSVAKAPEMPSFDDKAPQDAPPVQTAKTLVRYFHDNYHPDATGRWAKSLMQVAVDNTQTGAGLKQLSASDAKALQKYLAAGERAEGDVDSADVQQQQAQVIGQLAGYINAQPGLFRVSPAPGDFAPVWKSRLDISRKAAEELPSKEHQLVQGMIDSIQDAGIKSFVQEAFNKVPKSFYMAPSSSTGKFHPADEVDPNDLDPVEINKRNHAAPGTVVTPEHPYQGGGLVLHSARTVEVGKHLTDLLGIKGRDKDVVLAGLALHDIMKFATSEAVEETPAGQDVPWTKWTTPDHGPAGALWLSKLDPKQKELAGQISHYVEYHMAHWNEPHHTPPANLPELVVSLSDYLASQSNFYVQV